MKIFSTIFDGQSNYENLINNIKTNESGNMPISVFGLSHIHKAAFINSIVNRIKEKNALVLAADESEGRKLVVDINQFAGYDIAAFYPARDFVFRNVDGISREFENERLSVLGNLCLKYNDTMTQNKNIKIIVACGDGAIQNTIPNNVFLSNTFKISIGEPFSQEKLTNLLYNCGYVKRPQIEGICQYSVRGGIVDFFLPDSKFPVRIEFWGDDIDSMSYFDIESQRRNTEDRLNEIIISPAREIIIQNNELADIINSLIPSVKSKNKDKIIENLNKDLELINSGIEMTTLDKYMSVCYKKTSCLLDYFDNPLIFVSDYNALAERIKNYIWQQNEDIKDLLEEGVLFGKLNSFYFPSELFYNELKKSKTILLDTFAKGYTTIPVKATYNFNLSTIAVWSGLLSTLTEDLSFYKDKKYCVVISVKTEKAAKTLVNDLSNEGISAQFTDKLNSITLNRIFITVGNFSSGFEILDSRFALISQGFNQKTNIKKAKIKKSEQFGSLEDLTVGDYVVHISHGIGIFDGIQKLEMQGIVKDYIKIRYQGSDTLFLPVTQLDMVAKYLGSRNDNKVKLNRLNSIDWEKTKAKVKNSVKEMAKELIDLYAKRLSAKGYSFPADDIFQEDFDNHFEYQETDDQLTCIREIKEDMQKDRPMDRLLCGDVGFGKTEVALRAAFKCVYDGKQCAILVPTTILAWQHYQTTLKRFEEFPIKIEILSRYRSPKQQKEIIKKLKSGEIDLIIGTHRLVQNDIEYKDLGLAIIDEEQRFGVAHKEKFKQLFKGIDILTLSATPIPRTLNMAMSGIRDMSVIEQAPVDRHPVQTYVMEYNDSLIADAIKKELRRGGQVFYLHNNVETISECAHHLKTIVPESNVDIGHGKMTEQQLSKVWEKLLNKEIDVLCCTTIIETGVDVSNCNTLIIENADRLGLSQLYQLRGRVGRSSRRAFAYLTFTRGKILTEVAVKRLEAIKEFTNFGSGFKIAMRDLQIRGAGSVLGANQSGHMEAVGYDMYVRLLSQAVSEERGEVPTNKAEECLIDVRIGAHIPDDYIQNSNQRIEIYKKIAAIKNEQDKMEVIDELIDRFGEPNKAVQGLMDISMLRNMASEIGIYEINQKNNNLLFFAKKINFEKASALSGELRGKVFVNASEKPYISVKLAEKQSVIEMMSFVLTKLS